MEPQTVPHPLNTLAQANLHKLSINSYPGRGIVVGMSEDAQHLIQIAWTMGRRKKTRNRVYEHVGGRLFTSVADPSKPCDVELGLYNAMDETKNCCVVSNGSQTDTVVRGIQKNFHFAAIMQDCSYEPDEPNYTPRITAVLWTDEIQIPPITKISILRKSPADISCVCTITSYDALTPGFGYCVHTYAHDGNPLPSFQGEPYPVPLRGTPREILDTYCAALDAENRVSLAVKFIPQNGGPSIIRIKNRYDKVSA